MRFSISDFDRKLAQGKEAREQLTNEINDLLRQEAALDAEANAAADAGDVDLYESKANAKNHVHATIFVKRRQLDRLGPTVNEADADAAWSDYVATYNKKLQAALDAFEETKEKFYQQYSDLVSLQHDALAVREHLGAAVGVDKNRYRMEFVPVQQGPSVYGALKIYGFNCPDPDSVFYLSMYCRKNKTTLFNQGTSTPDPEAERVFHVVVNHN